MLGMLEQFQQYGSARNIKLVPASVRQVLSVEELLDLVPKFEGWIIGDDPATRQVFEAGAAGRLRAAVKWGIGVDNVDFSASEELGIPITNTPDMFGTEVADLAIGYLLGLARHSFYIDREIRALNWPKPPGISVTGKKVGVVGYGDIGRNVVRRLQGFDVEVTVYDPFAELDSLPGFAQARVFPEGLERLDFLVLTCSLGKDNFHMINEHILQKVQKGIRLINVARGGLIDESALGDALQEGIVGSAALDVFETEPLPSDSLLRKMPYCIFGSHNGSNTAEAVTRASEKAIALMAQFLDG